MNAVDEMVSGTGRIHPHWGGILGNLSAMGDEALRDRARRLSQAAEDAPAGRHWRCDPVPLPLPPAEFVALQAGLVQRATLLEAVLADLYGEQALLAEGAIPPALVHANPGFQRACHPASPPAAPPSAPSAPRFLQSLAVDLMRGADRQWRVVADRTDGAPGIGYARENRRVLAELMPELFRSRQVHQLSPFFEAWQEALVRLSPRPGTGPHPPVIAMLTHGPADPHWPEHLALSRDLACALVDARDLTVRHGVLSIKALQGLQPVDVLLRRVPGQELDPLELPGGTGVTGLLDVARAGSVRLVNHPGAAAIEAPAFAAFLPALAARLLHEPLRLDGRPTLWLGDPASARLAQEAPDRWRRAPAFGTARPGSDPQLDPWAWVACAAGMPSVAPCFTPGGLAPRPVVLRMFLMHDGVGWHVMPGGLACVMQDGETMGEWPAADAVFKDVWVMRDDAGVTRGPDPAHQAPIAIRRTAVDMPSRVADDFYWLGRYVERLETQARLARAGLRRRSRGAPLPRELAELAILLRCVETAGLDPAEPGTSFDDRIRTALLPDGAIGTGLNQAARLIDALRDRMTVETHGAFAHALAGTRADVAAAANSRHGAGFGPLVHAMAGVQGLATTVAGVAAEGMVRGGGRLFLDLGRRIERAMVGSHVLATVLDQPPVRIDGALRLALELCDSVITYRGRYFGVVQPAPVLDLVLADTGNPRALAFQFEAASILLETAGDVELAGIAASLQRRSCALVTQVQAAEVQSVEAVAIAATLAEIGGQVATLSDRITRHFFAQLPKLQSVGLETA